MARASLNPPPGFDDLSVDEKLDYVQSLWDRIATDPAELPVPDWHQRVIEERLAAHRGAPEAALPGEEVRRELDQKLKDRRSSRE
ncbi:MAG TPA: addiction module protein [Thermoanaerobaculia bacterium]|nr:addiction module protein [Thermoanaerobaculia bacterium]